MKIKTISCVVLLWRSNDLLNSGELQTSGSLEVHISRKKQTKSMGSLQKFTDLTETLLLDMSQHACSLIVQSTLCLIPTLSLCSWGMHPCAIYPVLFWMLPLNMVWHSHHTTPFLLHFLSELLITLVSSFIFWLVRLYAYWTQPTLGMGFSMNCIL